MRVKVEIPNLKQVIKDVDKVRLNVNSVLGKAVKEGADLIKDDALQNIHNRTGELASGVKSEVTWDKNKSKAFAGVGMDGNMNDKFVYHTQNGVRYYIPAAVEYGHRPPGRGGFVVMTTVKRGKRAGQYRAAASSKQGKSAKPRSFMRKALKAKRKEVEALILARIKEALE